MKNMVPAIKFFLFAFFSSAEFQFVITYSIVGNKAVYTLPVKGNDGLSFITMAQLHDGTKVNLMVFDSGHVKEVALKYTSRDRRAGSRKGTDHCDILAMEKQVLRK